MEDLIAALDQTNAAMRRFELHPTPSSEGAPELQSAYAAKVADEIHLSLHAPATRRRKAVAA